MADSAAVDALKRGVAYFREWRAEHPDVFLDLRGAVLDDLELENVDLRGANLEFASMRRTRMGSAVLDGCRCRDTDLTAASLCDATLEGSVFTHSSRLVGADLSRTYLAATRFHECDLSDADLACALLIGTEFSSCDLNGCEFGGASLMGAAFFNVDLSSAKNLARVDEYYGPAAFDVDTFRRSRGRLPENFLRHAGFSDAEVLISKLWDPDLTQSALTDVLYKIDELRGTQPIQRRGVFISYSHVDDAFVSTLHAALDRVGVRCWRDKHDLLAGRVEKQIDRAIRLNSAVILVLSRHSVQSDWVEWEASRARDIERDQQRDVLCPIALDDSWKSCDWPGPLRKQLMKYHILDFSEWSTNATFDVAFRRLVDGLDVFYRSE